MPWLVSACPTSRLLVSCLKRFQSINPTKRDAPGNRIRYIDPLTMLHIRGNDTN